MSEQNRTDSDVVAELAARAASKVETVLVDPETAVLAVPDGVEVVSIKPFLDEYLEAPERRKGTARLGTLASFLGLVHRFKDLDSALFANPDGTNHPPRPTLTCVFDYNREGPTGAPRFGQHRAVYEFPVSDEWKAWLGLNGKPMAQAQFAAFLEDRIADVAAPTSPGALAQEFAQKLLVSFAGPSRLIELSRGLSIRVDQTVRNAQNLQTGEAQVQFVAQHTNENGQPLNVPGAFLLNVPVFRGGALYEIPARLRYRVKEGAITWFYELYRADRIFDHAFDEACEEAQENTELSLFVGTPEQ